MLFTRLRSSMKTVVIAVSVAFVASLFYMGYSQRNRGDETGEAVVKVNGKSISREEWMKNFYSYAQYHEQSQGPINGDQILTIKASILDQMVDQKLMLQAAKEEGTKVDKKAVEKEFDRIKNQFPTKEAFRQALTENNLTEKALQEQIQQTNLLETFQADKRKELKVTEADLKKAYEEVKASHILIQADTKAKDDEAKKKDAEAKTEAEAVLAKIKAGEDFAKLAKEHSDDPGSKESGGDLGFFGRGKMVKEFDKVAFSLGVGEVSDIVKTEFGYHIIKVTDRKEAKGKEYQKAKKDLKKTVAETKYGEWFDNYRDEAKVEFLDHEVKAMRLANDKKYDKALIEYGKAAEADPNNAYIYVNQGLIYKEKKDMKNALVMFEKAVEVNESDPNIRLTLGNAYRENKEADKAIAEYKRASDLAPTDFYLHFNLLTVYQQMGKADEVKAEEAKLKKIYELMETQRKAQEEQQKLLEEQQKAAEEAAKEKDQADKADKGSADSTTEEDDKK